MSLDLALTKLLLVVLETSWADRWPSSFCLPTRRPGCQAAALGQPIPFLVPLPLRGSLYGAWTSGLIHLSPFCGIQATRVFLSPPHLIDGKQESCEGKERAQPVDRVRITQPS